jgi:hypothetical protein
MHRRRVRYNSILISRECYDLDVQDTKTGNPCSFTQSRTIDFLSDTIRTGFSEYEIRMCLPPVSVLDPTLLEFPIFPHVTYWNEFLAFDLHAYFIFLISEALR